MSNNKVVILIITHNPKLNHLEKISIQQATRVLRPYPIYFVCPSNMDTSFYEEQFPSCKFHLIAPYWLSSYERSNRLKVTPKLYKSFSDYEYILFHEPDAFIFKDELLFWCEKGYSYIGAPWLERMDYAKSDAPYIGVGNSGLSLRNVADHLKSFKVHRRLYYWSDLDWYLRGGKSRTYQFIKFIYRLVIGNTTIYPFNNFWKNEDIYWGKFIGRIFDWYIVAPVEDARKFSFEVHPKRMFRDNYEQLPFGCHAWWRYDLEFWRPYIEGFGYEIKKNNRL